MWENFIWIILGSILAILLIAWIYVMVRMASYGWHRGKYKALRDNEHESQEENNPTKE